MKPMIGILAGMGPRSTSPFIDMVVDECQRQYAAKHDIDFPQMSILSHPTPFFLDRPIDHVAMKKSILDGLQMLERSGAAFIAMPCNSAHLYFDDLQASINVPLLNIVTEALQSVSGTRVTVFGTVPTLQSGLYQAGIMDVGAGFTFDVKWQGSVIDIISYVKSGDLQTALLQWKALMGEAKSQGVDTVIAACTELSCLIRGQPTDLHVVDSAQALAAAVVRRYRSLVLLQPESVAVGSMASPTG